MSKTFFDLRVSLQDSDLTDYAKDNKISTISGFEMYKYQFLKQFELYTNHKLKTTVFQNSIKKLFY